MKSYRELTMSQEPEIEQQSLGFDYDSYEKNYYETYTPKDHYDYKPPIEGQINISMIITEDEVGDMANEDSPRFNEAKAEMKASDIALARLKDITGDNYVSKYTTELEINGVYGEYTIEIKLTPKQ